ncbi:hypothetical protein PHISCL_06715 [Aspergillus sclerotialis]|uniref:Transferase family n=1 Tax=Aspergillus sclerotialis TaxID=2070753 RepID=A0A3A2ZV99_9EURO|nr:hypothetical protein PHISCL_06715 [Aspergillus sclerotialis]
MDTSTQSPTFTTLGCLDDIMPDIDLPMILSFACPTSRLQIAQQNLYRSFKSLLDKSPWLNGYIHSNVGGLAGSYRVGSKFLSHSAALLSSDVEHMNDKREKIEFQDLSSHTKYKAKTYSELVSENMPNRYLSPKLLVPNRTTENPNVKHAIRARVSFVKHGVFVVLSTSHSLMDATSLSAIFGEWLPPREEKNLHSYCIHLSGDLVGPAPAS